MRGRSYAWAMSRVGAAALSLTLVLAACTSSGDESTTSSAGDTQTTTTVATPTTLAPTDERLAIATVGGDIRIIDGAGTELSVADPGEGAAYRQPVWSSDGVVLASFASVEEGTGLAAIDPDTGDVRWEAVMTSPPFYYLPAPAGSDDATTSLRNDPGGRGLIAELIDRSGIAREIARISPFYAAWSPDGTSLAVHGEGEYVEVRTGEETLTVAEPSGQFQAPAWTTDGLVTLRTTDAGQLLSVWTDGAFRDLARVDGPVRFSATDGKVAIQAIPEDAGDGVQAAIRTQTVPDLPGGRLVVVDVASGAIETVTNMLTPMFQWDPTGTRLLFATFEGESGLDFAWNVWESGDVTEGPSWQAQPVWFRDVVPFFDQFVQSLSLWSPDGTAYAYAEVVDARPVVTIQPVDGSPARSIENATWVSWWVPSS